ncbi:hypothetical protein RND81_14G205400 [Saponaria officinalis]|uniref:AAA ATPase AAA+ lid domain-containing protein n=1 Tax=Saponaria officinalis TaxID=3572 RepID=A0AAW1GW14_SAPOF
MTLADDVNLEQFIMSKDDLSGADVKAICMEAGLLALRERRMKVNFYSFLVDLYACACACHCLLTQISLEKKNDYLLFGWREEGGRIFTCTISQLLPTRYRS